MRKPVLVGVVTVAVLAATVIGVLVLRPVRVTSGSMAPALEAGDWVVTTPRGEVARGDVVMFRFPPGSDRRAVKRVVAVAGDRVEISPEAVRVGTTTHATGGAPTQSAGRPRVEQVPHGHVFLLGDNGPASIDSRSFGPLSLDEVVARQVFSVRRTTAAATLVGSSVGLVVLLAVRRMRRNPPRHHRSRRAQ